MRPTNCAGPCAGCQEESGQRRVVSGQLAVQPAGARHPAGLVAPGIPRPSASGGPRAGRRTAGPRNDIKHLCVIPRTRSEAEGRGIPGASDNKGPPVPGQSERRRSWGFLGRTSASGGPRAGWRTAGLGMTLNVSVSFRAPGAKRRVEESPGPLTTKDGWYRVNLKGEDHGDSSAGLRPLEGQGRQEYGRPRNDIEPSRPLGMP